MKTLELIDKTREYLDYIENHVVNVARAWNELQAKCKDLRFIYDDYVFHSIDSAVQEHDLSKLSEEEFIEYRRCFYPCGDEPKMKLGKSWEHHKEHNPHHWENWTADETVYLNPFEWEVHCVHMVVDWMAMGYHFNDTAQEYYEKHKDNIKLPDHVVSLIYEIFEKIK